MSISVEADLSTPKHGMIIVKNQFNMPVAELTGVEARQLIKDIKRAEEQVASHNTGARDITKERL